MIQIFARDVKLAFRSGGGFGLALVFFLIVVFLVPLGVGPSGNTLAVIAPGIIWVGALLACLLSLDRILTNDWEDGSLELLATSPIPLEAVILSKAAAHWITTGLPLAIAAPVLSVLLNMPSQGFFFLCISLLVGTPALSLIGAFGAALTLGVKRGGLLLSIIVLPLYVPTLIFGAEVASRGAGGQPIETPLLLLGAVTFGTLAALPFAAAAALRLSLR